MTYVVHHVGIQELTFFGADLRVCPITEQKGEHAGSPLQTENKMPDDNSNIHHRRSIRLKDYDYSQSGAYFVTICTHNKACLFGHVEGETIILNNVGKMIEKWFWELEKKFFDIKCMEHIVMPNHIHFVIQNIGMSVVADLRVCPVTEQKGERAGSPLPKIIQWFKTMSTNEYIRSVKNNHLSPFTGKLWQRNYYEHIIRNDDELNRVREYILNNPINWFTDEYNHSRDTSPCLPNWL